MKRPLLLPLAPLWAAGVTWKNRGFDRHPARAQRLQQPVISVGSLSAGGAGKTPFVMALGRALQRHGVAVDILSRGYGRTIGTETAWQVDPAGLAEEFGDEPLLIARSLDVPVYVASQRVEAGRLAERDRPERQRLHLLDDGFQHRQLARAADIVLVTLQDVRDTLLPAGDLREPLTSLRRADVLVLRSDEVETVRPVLTRVFGKRAVPPVWTIDRSLSLVEGTPTARPLAFCGIARPQGFRAALLAHGITPAALVALRDHQRYDGSVVERLLQAARGAGADGFVTTAKDAVKLTPAHRQMLQAHGPLTVADIAVCLREEEQSVSTLINLLQRSST